MISTWKFAKLLWFSCFVFHINIFHAQESSLSRPGLDTIPGKQLIVRYDILNSDPGESFNFSLEISDSKGAAINPSSLTGDIGINISGGNNKEILPENITFIRNAERKDNIHSEQQLLMKMVAYQHLEKS